MKQNMLVTSYDYAVSKRLAIKLAETFSMRILDAIELFEFDHIPFKVEEILEKNGPSYVLKKMRSIIEIEIDFDDAVFVAGIDFADHCQDLFQKIKYSNFVILLKKDIDEEISEIKSKVITSYNNVENKEILLKRETIIEENCADIVVNISGISDDEVVDKITAEIKKYYQV